MANTDIDKSLEDELSSGEADPVSLEQVESYFSRLWRNVAEAAQQKGGSQPVTTAQVLNLVVHSGTRDEGQEYVRDMELITGRHPCRIINVVSDPVPHEQPVHAYISIHCKVPPAGGRQVCSELLTVVSGKEDTREIPAAVIPLLISDLPTFMWWPRGTPFDDTLFRNLTDSMDRLIVDSATFENSEGTLSKMSNRLKTNWPKLVCTDMNWGRLTHWRELVAQFFDGAVLRPYLDRINNVTIDFTLSERGAVNRTQALLLAGWLSSRLGWRPADQVYELVRADSNVPGARLSLQSTTAGPVTIMLNAIKAPSEVPGSVHMVSLEVRAKGLEGKPEASFTVALPHGDRDSAHTCTEIAGVEPTDRPMQMVQVSRAELLDIELGIFSRDLVYEAALEMAGAFIQGSVKREGEGPRKLSTGEPMSAGSQTPRSRSAENQQP